MHEVNDPGIKQQVREFYDQVGWQQVSDGIYQNARYEDLRPVSREYIHRCHLRVGNALAARGDLLLDAGSGPVQYPEYLTYSENYQHRVCADLSITALQEARQRLGDHGLYVVCDILHLPFKDEAFDSIVSLHAIHHVPYEHQPETYLNLFRTLKQGQRAAIVNAWKNPRLMERWNWFMRLMERVVGIWQRLVKPGKTHAIEKPLNDPSTEDVKPTGTYTQHYDAGQLLAELSRLGIPAEIKSWRSLSVRFLRAVIQPGLAGRAILRLVFWLEERYPAYFGRNGQYPLIILNKPEQEQA